MTRAAAAMRLEDLTEKQWQRQVVSLAQQLGFAKAYHTFDSRRSATGFPDLVLVRDRIIYAELKREPKVATPLTAVQREWLDRLAQAGGECYLWRPSDLDEIARLLSKRWTFIAPLNSGGRLALEGPGPYFVDDWQPRSLWVPGVGRSDTTEQQQLLTKGAAA